MMCTVDQRIPGNIGLPARGITLKLVPVDTKFEARLKGPNITPGYWRDEKLTAQAFDEEGFYRLGDALRFADPDDVSKGFYFDGRIGENFKLTSGTWVSVGALRARFIDYFTGLVRDIAIAGLDRDYIAGLVVPDVAACRTIAASLPADAPLSELLSDDRVRAAFAARLREFSRTSTGSSTSVKRIILMHEPLSIDAGEVTDKGSLNQRTVIANHADLVDELYRGSPRVIAV
jgi:feruloyl-CoA synthase